MKKYIKKIIIFTLILSAFLLRAYKWTQLDMFAGDEGIQLIYAEDILNRDYFTVTGELSSLDQNSKFKLHNSPLGIYFQTLLYILSFRSEIMFLFLYSILNFLTAFFLYKATLIITSKKIAKFAGIILLFSPFMLNASVWTSQPVNSLFFESIAIFLVAYYIKYNNEKMFLYGSIMSLIATQMYPPMYLLLVPKAILFLYILIKKIENKNSIFLLFFLSAFIIYLPFVAIEYKYNYANTNSVILFLQGMELNNVSETEINPLNFIQKTIKLNEKIMRFFSNEFVNHSKLTLLYILVLFIGFIKKSDINAKKLLLFSSSFVFIPIGTLIALFFNASISGDRAYINIIFPFVIILFCIIHKHIPQYLLNFSVLIYILVTILPMNGYYFRTHERTNLYTIQSTVNFAMYDAKQKQQPFPFFHVISPSDIWGWDSSMYWYLLEKKLNIDLVSIEFYSGKAKLNNPHTIPKYLYLICANYQETLCLNNWKTIANSNLYGKKTYTFKEKYNINNGTMFIVEMK